MIESANDRPELNVIIYILNLNLIISDVIVGRNIRTLSHWSETLII